MDMYRLWTSISITTIYLMMGTGRSQQLISGPTPVSVALNNNATFKCSAENTDLLFWTMNGFYANTLALPSPTFSNDDSTLNSTWIIPVNCMNYLELNNSNISCDAVNLGQSMNMKSEEVDLRVQGMLCAPCALNSSYDCKSNNLYLQWNPSFLTGGTAVEFVACINYDDAINGNGDQCYSTFNTTELMINLTSNGTSLHVCYSAHTLDGSGNESCVLTISVPCLGPTIPDSTTSCSPTASHTIPNSTTSSSPTETPKGGISVGLWILISAVVLLFVLCIALGPFILYFSITRGSKSCLPPKGKTSLNSQPTQTDIHVQTDTEQNQHLGPETRQTEQDEQEVPSIPQSSFATPGHSSPTTATSSSEVVELTPQRPASPLNERQSHTSLESDESGTLV